MGNKSYTYTSFGEVDIETDANSIDYDVLGRLTDRKVNGVVEASFSYDPDGCKGYTDEEQSVGELANGSYNRAYRYDSLCRATNVITTIDNVDYTQVTQFDSGYGRVKALTYPTGLTVASLYNARGFLTETQDATSGYVYQKTPA